MVLPFLASKPGTRKQPRRVSSQQPPRDQKLHHINAPQRMWFCRPIPSGGFSNQRTPRSAGLCLPPLVGRPVFTGPLGTVRTRYTITLEVVNPCAPRRLHARHEDERIRSVANLSFMASPHSTLDGTIGFITDLRLPSVVATVDSALRVWAWLRQARATECRGAVGPSCRGGSSGQPECALPEPGTRARRYPEVRNRNRCSCVFNSDGFRRTVSGLRPTSLVLAVSRKFRGWSRTTRGRGLFVGRTGDGVGR